MVEIPSRPPTSIFVNLVEPNGQPESLQGHIRANILLVACERVQTRSYQPTRKLDTFASRRELPPQVSRILHVKSPTVDRLILLEGIFTYPSLVGK